MAELKNPQLEIMSVVTQGFALVAEHINALKQQQDFHSLQLAQQQQIMQAQHQQLSAQAAATYKALPHSGKAAFVYALQDQFENQTALGQHLGISQGRVSQLVKQHKVRIGEK